MQPRQPRQLGKSRAMHTYSAGSMAEHRTPESTRRGLCLCVTPPAHASTQFVEQLDSGLELAHGTQPEVSTAGEDLSAAGLEAVISARVDGESDLRVAIAALKKSELTRRARLLGVPQEVLDEVEDAEDVKAAMLELIVEKVRAVGNDEGGAQSAADQLELWMQTVRRELGAMKKSELKKCARSLGVKQDKLDEAGDFEDETAVVVELILEKMRQEGDTGAKSRCHLDRLIRLIRWHC